MVDELTQESFQTGKAIVTVSVDLITAIADACKRSEQQNPGMSEEQKETLLGKVVDKVMSNYKETHGSLKGFNREGKDVTHIDVNDERTAELLEKACKKSHIPMDMKEVTRADGSITHTAFCEVKSIDQVAALLKMASEQVLEEQKEMTKTLVLYDDKGKEVMSADFVNNGQVYRAVRYTNPQTNVSEFYTPDGKSMRKAFLRTPVNFTRISSRFTTNRFHPVLHKFRSHKGVDYAAKRGTPIYAAGDGKVIFKGKKGGYGNVMILQHGTKYTTLYAHLKTYNRKLKVGSKVKQGQTIAYVGKSGLATGPHLHYEFRVNGTHRNPLTVKLPESSPVPKRYMADFELTTTPVFAQLELVTRSQQVALADTITDTVQ